MDTHPSRITSPPTVRVRNQTEQTTLNSFLAPSTSTKSKGRAKATTPEPTGLVQPLPNDELDEPNDQDPNFSEAVARSKSVRVETAGQPSSSGFRSGKLTNHILRSVQQNEALRFAVTFCFFLFLTPLTLSFSRFSCPLSLNWYVPQNEPLRFALAFYFLFLTPHPTLPFSRFSCPLCPKWYVPQNEPLRFALDFYFFIKSNTLIFQVLVPPLSQLVRSAKRTTSFCGLIFSISSFVNMKILIKFSFSPAVPQPGKSRKTNHFVLRECLIRFSSS